MNEQYMGIEGLAFMIDKLYPGIYPGIDYICRCEYAPDGVTLTGHAVLHQWNLPSEQPSQEFLLQLWESTYKQQYEIEVSEWHIAEERRKQRVIEGSLIDPSYTGAITPPEQPN